MVRVLGATAAVVGAPVGTGCEQQAESTEPASLEVVAKVEGVPISLGQVDAYAQTASVDRRTAARHLVERQLLAEEASRRGYADHPSVQHAERRAAVQLLLQQEVEAPEHSSIARSEEPERDDARKDRAKRRWKRLRELMVRLQQEHEVVRHEHALETALGSQWIEDPKEP